MRHVLLRLVARWLGDDWGPRSPLRFAFQRLREYWLRALAIAGLSTLTAAFEGGSLALMMLGLQVLISQNVEQSLGQIGRIGRLAAPLVAGRTPTGAFVALVLTAVAVQLLRSVSTYGTSVASIFLQNRIARTAIARSYERVLALDYPTIVRQRGGEVSYKATAMPTLAIIIQQMMAGLQALVMVAGYTVLLVLIAPMFAVVVVGGAVLLSFVMGFIQRAVRRHAEAFAKVQQDVAHVGVEMLQSFRLVHTHATWDETSASIKRLIETSYLSRRRFEILSAAIGPSFEALLTTSVAGLLLAIVLFEGNNIGRALSGTLVCLLIVYRAMPWANVINQVRASLAQNLPPLSYAASLFNDPDLGFRPTGLPALDGALESIRVEGLTYVYPESEAPAVDGVTFEVPAGGCVALVGASGSGKSTLTDLLIGLREPTSGAIRVNGSDLASLDQASWRAKLGVVSQDTFLFNVSLGENIAYGLEYDEERLRRATRLAHVDEFVRELPDGYGTMVGDRGYRLSGGQRQRVALARALYRHPELLILDEATSALDSASERIVQRAIEESIGTGITTVIVAHRLSTVARADEILVLDRGRVVERGTHAALLAKGSVYAHLWSIQSLTETTEVPAEAS